MLIVNNDDDADIEIGFLIIYSALKAVGQFSIYHLF